MLKPNRLKLLFVLLALLSLLQFNLSCGNQEEAPPPKNHDQTSSKNAPSFVLNDLGGNQVSSQEFAGKITVINFWATWCKFCRVEIKHLNKLYDEYHNQGVAIIGISLDSRGAADVIPFLKKIAVEYPILIGDQKIGWRFGGIVGLPTTVIVDQDWKIYQKYPGLVDKSVLEGDIKKLLARK
jgi:thiol-disulfide isomerase/thioredoxin